LQPVTSSLLCTINVYLFDQSYIFREAIGGPTNSNLEQLYHSGHALKADTASGPGELAEMLVLVDYGIGPLYSSVNWSTRKI